MSELEEKLKNGLLVELPCKIGTEIFAVLPIEIIHKDSITTTTYNIRKMPFDYRHIPWFNDTVFINEETAEKRCRELNAEERKKREEQNQKKRGVKHGKAV